MVVKCSRKGCTSPPFLEFSEKILILHNQFFTNTKFSYYEKVMVFVPFAFLGVWTRGL